ncbi:hypothetical protein [uncultured Polaribacter sp.]|nr:hypothetical protein [uncultured Polaribacter sp.]
MDEHFNHVDISLENINIPDGSGSVNIEELLDYCFTLQAYH